MDQLEVNIRLKYVILILGIFTTTVVAGALWHNAQHPDVILAAVAAGTAITGLVYTAINAQLTSQIHVEQLRLKKLENAMTFIEYSTSPDLVRAVSIGVALREEIKNRSAAEVKQMLKDAPEKSQALIMIFNYFERLGLASG